MKMNFCVIWMVFASQLAKYKDHKETEETVGRAAKAKFALMTDLADFRVQTCEKVVNIKKY